jgi:hypothetical protein
MSACQESYCRNAAPVVSAGVYAISIMKFCDCCPPSDIRASGLPTMRCWLRTREGHLAIDRTRARAVWEVWPKTVRRTGTLTTNSELVNTVHV